jgi:DNA-binding transcriptional MerR regulator
MAVAVLVAVSAAGAQSTEQMIAQAVLPLPEELRARATVFSYDDATGERIVLRQGDNQVECQPRNEETGFTRCFPVADAARRDFAARLEAQGKSRDEIAAALAAAEAAGTIEPTPFGSLRYRLYEKNDRIQLLWVVALPNARAADLGMSTASQRDESLAGEGRPWMMREGTPGAHLMIPINATELSNPGAATLRLKTTQIEDPVVQAVLPLPEDLRADATVVSYDAGTGERHVLRQGSSTIECQPRDAETGFTRCYHKALGAEQDLVAKLRAEGTSNEDIRSAVAAAREAGAIPPVPFGSLAYRLYENDDRLKLLWVLRLPNATSADLGMPIASQRDESLAGKGRPWMMREGTPAAHLMIPINGTELSN